MKQKGGATFVTWCEVKIWEKVCIKGTSSVKINTKKRRLKGGEPQTPIIHMKRWDKKREKYKGAGHELGGEGSLWKDHWGSGERP